VIQARKGRPFGPAYRSPGSPFFTPTLWRRSVFPALLLLLCVGRAFASDASPTPPSQKSPSKSLVLITVEGLRPDYLSCYRKGRGKSTPGIDRLAAEGRLFEQVVAPSVSSLPSLATLLTGKTPFEHQVWDDQYRNRLGDQELTLAEQLKAKGYRTGAFLGTSRAASGRGFDQGFDIYQDGYVPSPKGIWNLVLRPSQNVMDGARSWLQGVGDGPFFLWVHLSDPIVPEQGTAEEPATELEKTYVERLGTLDKQIGALLDLLRLRKDYETLTIALTADHGFGLGEHGEPRAGVFLYESTLRVPLILRAPVREQEKGARTHQLSGLVDLYPTLARLLDVAAPSGISGRDLLSDNPVAPEAYHATALLGREAFGWAGSEVVAQGERRLILGPQTELYDVAADPGETRNLSSSLPSEVSRLKGTLQKLSRGASIPRAHFQMGPAPADATRTRLKQLGMVPPTLEKALARSLPDPLGLQGSLALLEEMAFRTEVFGNLILVKTQESLLQADPQSLFTLLGVGAININAEAGGLKKTKELMKTAQRLYPLDSEVYHQLGHIALSERRWSDAIFFLKTSLDLRPQYAGEVVYDLACAYARNGDKIQALKQLRESIRLGFRDSKHIASDPDLESLRADAGYKKLMEEDFQAPSKP